MMITSARTALSGFALLGLALALAACPASLDDRCAEGACAPRAGEGGVDVVDAGSDAPTDPCIDTPTDPKCLDESTSLFVSSPNGNDQDPTAGTRDKPLKTIGAALKKIDQAKRRIYVCEGTYPEDIALTATHSQLSIFGGVDCAWKAAPAIKPVIGASANPFTTDGTTALALADIAVVATDATTGSSIALFVKEGDVTLKRVKLTAGKGADGASATLTPFANFPSQAELNGNMAPDGTNGGPEKKYTCPGGFVTTGGKGGDAAFQGNAGTPGLTDNKGAIAACGAGGTGGDGVGGTTGKSGDAGTTAGELDATGWASPAGLAGQPGGPGQGGGGGYGTAGAGGGGGAGGCGGAGGPGGQGGGASIALASYLAKVTVEASTLAASDAGSGGKGALGQDGQTIVGFRGTGSGGACQGGNGGPGGKGGAGAGGSGGSSLGVAYKGTKPVIDAPTLSALALGKKGAGGQLAGTNPGADGVQANELGGD